MNISSSAFFFSSLERLSFEPPTSPRVSTYFGSVMFDHPDEGWRIKASSALSTRLRKAYAMYTNMGKKDSELKWSTYW